MSAGTATRSWSPCAITGADVFRENNPNIPYTTEEIADSAIEAAEAGATIVHLHVREDDGTPSGRPELFVDVIDRIRAGSDLLTMVSTGGANDMTIEERTTGLEAKPGHLGRRVGLDELRRRDLHHAAAGGARDRRARHRGGHRARGRGLRRRPRGQRGALARAGDPPAADADQPRLRRARAASTPRPRRSTAMLRPLPERNVLDRHLHRPPPPAHAGAGAAERRARDPHRARGRRLHQPGASSRPPTPRSSRWRWAWPARSGARSRPRTRRRELLRLG